MDSVNSNQSNPSNWLESIKLYFKNLWDRLELSSCKIVEIVSFFGVGFLIGFIVKKYLQYFLIIIAILVLSLVLANYLDLIFVDWIKVKEFLGVNSTQTVGNLLQHYFTLIKENLCPVISSFIGFVIGYKIG